MTGLAPLVTYRGRDAEAIYRLFDRHAYFQVGRFIPYNIFLCLWLAILALLVTLRRKSRHKWRHLSAVLLPYSVSLTATGLLMILATCAVGDWLPRYALPMWQLTILSAFILLGTLADDIAARWPGRRNSALFLLSCFPPSHSFSPCKRRCRRW